MAYLSQHPQIHQNMFPQMQYNQPVQCPTTNTAYYQTAGANSGNSNMLSKYGSINIPTILANGILVYILASAYYFVITNWANTNIYQTKQQMRKQFYFGIVIAVVVVWYFQPLKRFLN